MPKTRMNFKHLSVEKPKKAKPGSYKNTLVWQWLQFAIAGQDEAGEAIRLMRKRMDMPNEFPHKTYLLHTYLIKKCKVKPEIAERIHLHLWIMFSQYRDAAKHNTSNEPLKPGQTRMPWKEEPVEDSPIVEGAEPEFKASQTKWLSR
jgi:hypothetical protein